MTLCQGNNRDAPRCSVYVLSLKKWLLIITLNILRLEQNGHHLADDIFKQGSLVQVISWHLQTIRCPITYGSWYEIILIRFLEIDCKGILTHPRSLGSVVIIDTGKVLSQSTTPLPRSITTTLIVFNGVKTLGLYGARNLVQILFIDWGNGLPLVWRQALNEGMLTYLSPIKLTRKQLLWNLNQRVMVFIHEAPFENLFCKISPILPYP